jgi:hypothetical protein
MCKWPGLPADFLLYTRLEFQHIPLKQISWHGYLSPVSCNGYSGVTRVWFEKSQEDNSHGPFLVIEIGIFSLQRVQPLEGDNCDFLTNHGIIKPQDS